MKVLKSWLKDYVEVTKNDEEISDILTFSGTLVEEIQKTIDDRVITAKIVEINKHPNADKLRLPKVDTGKEIIEIVCGAPNIEVGQIVPLATLGAKLGDFEIKEALIRGVKSNGMLCSEKELGISENHEGIMLLPAKTPLGIPLNQTIELDTVFDIEVTPNRGDCLSHLGIAREYAAASGEKFKALSDNKTNLTKKDNLTIEILEPELCYQYHGVIIENVKIGPSPDWLVKRLEGLGLKSINNVVDITNYIMLDLGQPLHAFDRTKIPQDKIVVRKAKEGEEIVSIDGEKRALDREMLVIANENEAIAIAGVMGGFDSEIKNDTTSIILESAEFERKSIRKTSKVLGLVSDASYRFERGIDPALTKTALEKAASMITEVCGGTVIDAVSDIASSYKNDWIKIEYAQINDLLGTNLTNEEIESYLTKLGFKINDSMAEAPSWRHDIEIWQDLAEEVARLYGLSNVPLVPMAKEPFGFKSDYFKKEYIKNILVDSGFVEVFTYSFLSEKDIKEAGLSAEDLLEVANPMQKENKYLRNSLVPGILRGIAKNPTFDPVMIFEIGNIFNKKEEKPSLVFAVSGKGAQKEINKAVQTLEEKLSLPKNKLKITELNRDDIQRFKIKKAVTCIVEVDVNELIKNGTFDETKLDLAQQEKTIHYRPISKFPALTRDIAFIVKSELDSNEIIDQMYEQSDLINRVELFDEFASDKFGKDMKNIAFHLYLEHQERTLKDEEAETVLKKIISSVEQKFNAKLRNY